MLSGESVQFLLCPGSARLRRRCQLEYAAGTRLAYQLQLEELASHGYIVFGLEHGTDSALIVRPDRTLLPYVSRRPPDPGPPTVAGLEDNRSQVIRRTNDIVFAMDQVALLARQAGTRFHERMDLSRFHAS